MAVVVSRGEPRRTNLQMEQAVADQARRYLAQHTTVRASTSGLAISVAVQLIAEDHINDEGAQAVMLTREHLLAYVKVARSRLGEVRKGERDAAAG